MDTDTSNYLFLRGKIKEMKKGTDLVHWFAVYTKPRNEKRFTPVWLKKALKHFCLCRKGLSNGATERSWSMSPFSVPIFLFVLVKGILQCAQHHGCCKVRYIRRQSCSHTR